MALTQQEIDEARLHSMLDNPHHAHAIAALTDDEIAEDAAAVSEADPNDDDDDSDDDADDNTDLFDDDADELEVDPEGDAQ